MPLDKLIQQARQLTGTEREEFIALLSPDIREKIQAVLSEASDIPRDPYLTETDISGQDDGPPTTEHKPPPATKPDLNRPLNADAVV